MSWQLLPHTADVKAAIDAPTHTALLEDALDLVRVLVVGDSPVEASREIAVPVDTEEPAEQLFRFVRELLYLNDTEGFLPCALRTTNPLIVLGETFDDDRHTVEHAIKALTRHQFSYRRSAHGYRVEMVFDL